MNDFEFEEELDDETEYEELIAELKEAAWNVLHDEPGCECGDWISDLITNYPTEVVDAFGNNPYEVYERLTDWWDCMGYEDERTGMCERYRDWAEYFCTEKSVILYDRVVELSKELDGFRDCVLTHVRELVDKRYI